MRRDKNLTLVKKPWGSFKILSKNQKTTIKILNLEKGKRTSFQVHKNRSEKWYVLHGQAIATLDDEITLMPGDEIFIEKNQPHRLEAIIDVIILEISFGNFQENDIKRLDDDFGRK